jgi:hypothetical protein
MQRLLALLLSAALVLPACATAGGTRVQTRGQVLATGADSAVLGEFARQMPAGTRVRATVTGNRSVRGTLLKTTDSAIFIQPRGRIAEPIVEIPLAQLLALEQDTAGGGGTGRAVAIGAAAGAGAAVGVLLILIAVFSD